MNLTAEQRVLALFVCVIGIRRPRRRRLAAVNQGSGQQMSAMVKVKTDWRNRLGEQELEHLIRLKKEGPIAGTAAASSLISAATNKFINAKPRR